MNSLISDLHVHTNVVDGDDYRKVVDTAVRRGIDVIAVTDHNRLSYNLLRRYASLMHGDKLLILPAEEINSKGGEVLAYGLSEEIRGSKKADLYELLDEVRDQDALAFIAHPYHPLFGLARTWPFGYGSKVFDNRLFDSVEVINYSMPGFLNKKAFFKAREAGLVGICGSDAHFAEYVGSAVTNIFSEKNVDDVIHALRKGDVGFEWTASNFVDVSFFIIKYLLTKKIGMVRRMEEIDSNTGDSYSRRDKNLLEVNHSF